MTALLKMLGADNEEQGIEIVTKFTNFLSDIRSATGTDGPEAALAAVKSAVGFVAKVEQSTGKSADEAVQAVQSAVEAGKGAAAVKADLDKVVEATGEKSVDAALGSIATAKNARDELLPKAQAALADAQKAQDEAEAGGLLKQLQDDGRITKAQEDTLWPSLSLEGKRAFAKTAPPINGKTELKPASEGNPSASTPAYDGKPFADLTFAERAALKKAQPGLYAQLDAAHKAANPD